MPPEQSLELTGPQFRRLSQALQESLTLAQFDQLLKLRLNINRESVALGDDYQTITFRVIDDANRKGWVWKLIDAARKERPNNAVFVEYAQILGVGPQGLPASDELERVIRQINGFLDIAQFRQRLGEIEGRVCRVDSEGGGIGTGFLLGPETVITNYHVVQDIIEGQKPLGALSLRFDFKLTRGGTRLDSGTIVPVSELVTYSQYDPADLRGDSLPDPSNLDYALLKLERRIGEEPIGGVSVSSETPPRGWLAIPDFPNNFERDTPLFIVQHPNKEPMKLALDTEGIIGLNRNGSRVLYRTNTEPGSSGSPCFDQNWQLIALHHSGDPKWLPKWNRGIPIKLIEQQIKSRGYGGHLGSPNNALSLG